MLVKLKMMLAFLFFYHYPLKQYSIYSLMVLIVGYAFKLTHEPVAFSNGVQSHVYSVV